MFTLKVYMENMLFVITAIIVWGIFAIRKDINTHNISTTLILSVNSNDEDKDGIPLGFASFSKKTNISFAIVPDMELFEPGENKTLKVSRVLFEEVGNQARTIYLQPRRVNLSQLKEMENHYIRCGWKKI